MRTAEHALADLVDLDRLQRACDSFAATGDIGLFVLDPGGTILVAAGWQDITTPTSAPTGSGTSPSL
jgi:hypothetical protein